MRFCACWKLLRLAPACAIHWASRICMSPMHGVNGSHSVNSPNRVLPVFEGSNTERSRSWKGDLLGPGACLLHPRQGRHQPRDDAGCELFCARLDDDLSHPRGQPSSWASAGSCQMWVRTAGPLARARSARSPRPAPRRTAGRRRAGAAPRPARRRAGAAANGAMRVLLARRGAAPACSPRWSASTSRAVGEVAARPPRCTCPSALLDRHVDAEPGRQPAGQQLRRRVVRVAASRSTALGRRARGVEGRRPARPATG